MMEKELMNTMADQKQMTIESREVARMIDMLHKHLLAKIDKYMEVLNGTEISPVEYFIESTYSDSKGETRKCYLLTKLGCEMVANKLTGTKGIAFTAKYVKRFNEMEGQLQKNQPFDSYMIEDPIKRAERWIEEERVRQLQAKQIEELKPDAEYTQKVLKSKSLVNVSTIAEDWGLTGVALNKILSKLKVQYQFQGKNQWHLYAQYKGKGYAQFSTIVKQTPNGTHSIVYMQWTQSGKKFISGLLQSKGFKPASEWVDQEAEKANLRKLLKQFDVKGGILNKN